MATKKITEETNNINVIRWDTEMQYLVIPLLIQNYVSGQYTVSPIFIVLLPLLWSPPTLEKIFWVFGCPTFFTSLLLTLYVGCKVLSKYSVQSVYHSHFVESTCLLKPDWWDWSSQAVKIWGLNEAKNLPRTEQTFCQTRPSIFDIWINYMFENYVLLENRRLPLGDH